VDEEHELLKLGETRLTGTWLKANGSVRADDVSRRIDWLVSHHLARVAESPDGWSVLLRDPVDGRYWELTFPSSHLHGGGPPLLVMVSSADAIERYQVTLPHAD
jgi:hypothetical protein